MELVFLQLSLITNLRVYSLIAKITRFLPWYPGTYVTYPGSMRTKSCMLSFETAGAVLDVCLDNDEDFRLTLNGNRCPDEVSRCSSRSRMCCRSSRDIVPLPLPAVLPLTFPLASRTKKRFGIFTVH